MRARERAKEGATAALQPFQWLIYLLADAQEDIGATDGVQPVEYSRIRAIEEAVGEGWDGRPGSGNQIRVKLRDEKPTCIGAGGGHHDIRADSNLKDRIGRRRH